ncbi:MAG: CBS domain-containing protein [Hyphomicrobiales bacterium]|nr:CBS domain-containing protein [Hyphomicrobiales bacterium]
MISNSTPLMVLDAVVIDTETTGLDPKKAQIVEIGAVRLLEGRIASNATFRRIVRPSEPIPPAAAAVHGLDDAQVVDAPSFAQVWPGFLSFMSGTLLIGHTLGFDLAVLTRECERASLSFPRPRTLDTRLLAQVVEPNLASFTLEGLASWLSLEVVERHSALGDALTTAAIFTALVPRLRDRGIRTLGEAVQACRMLTAVLDEQHRAGWVEVAEAPARVDSERTLGRIDSYPYRHRTRDVMHAPPQFVDGGMSVSAALGRMISERISSLYVAAGAEFDPPVLVAAQTGIVTERDILRAIARYGADALAMPVGTLMSRPLAVVPAEAFVYRAIGRMSRLKVRHLGVVDEIGVVVGALSARDLLRLRAEEAVTLGDEIDVAQDAHALGAAWTKLPQVASSLLAEQVNARDVAAVVSRELGALTRQAAVIAEERMRAAGLGAPPCSYAIAVLGSAGRGESLLAMDQDNAIVFAEGEPEGPQDAWFAELGRLVAGILDEVGVPYCKGGVMAKNPAWRGSLATWRARVGDWISRSRPEDLLCVDIFFDMRPVHGDGSLCTGIWREAFDAARGQTGFVKLLAEAAGGLESGLGLFGQFKTREGRIDLKRTGLFGIVTAARLLAIAHHVVERTTPARLAGVRALAIGGAADLDRLLQAQETFLQLLLSQQIADLEQGVPPSNAVAAKGLSAGEREALRVALAAVAHLDELSRDLIFRAG